MNRRVSHTYGCYCRYVAGQLLQRVHWYQSWWCVRGGWCGVGGHGYLSLIGAIIATVAGKYSTSILSRPRGRVAQRTYGTIQNRCMESNQNNPLTMQDKEIRSGILVNAQIYSRPPDGSYLILRSGNEVFRASTASKVVVAHSLLKAYVFPSIWKSSPSFIKYLSLVSFG